MQGSLNFNLLGGIKTLTIAKFFIMNDGGMKIFA